MFNPFKNLKIVVFIFMLILFVESCMEFPEEPSKIGQLSTIIVLNANPYNNTKNLRYHDFPAYYDSIDVSYMISLAVDKKESLNFTIIPATIIIRNDTYIFSFTTQSSDSNENLITSRGIRFPSISSDTLVFKGGEKYDILLETNSGFDMKGYTTIPGDFHFIPYKNGKYIKRTGANKWKMRWSKSINSYNYWFAINGLHDSYEEEMVVLSAHGNISGEEIEFSFAYLLHGHQTEPEIDTPLPDKFYAWVLATDENLYRYKFLQQDPAGWYSGFGVAGSTNLMTLEFEQNLNEEYLE
ncbi:hypothetical protein KJ688_09015 [bacterium]|nr:hypothetical protein [bacterium]